RRRRNPVCRSSVAARRRLVSDLLAIAPGVDAERVGEDRWAVRLAVRDVVRRRAARRIQPRLLPDALRDLVVGARGVAARAEASDLHVALVQGHAASEDDRPAADLSAHLAVVARLSRAKRVEWIARREPPQGV